MWARMYNTYHKGVHKSSIGQTWVVLPSGPWKTPCPTCWRHASTFSCRRSWAADIVEKEVTLRVG